MKNLLWRLLAPLFLAALRSLGKLSGTIALDQVTGMKEAGVNMKESFKKNVRVRSLVLATMVVLMMPLSLSANELEVAVTPAFAASIGSDSTTGALLGTHGLIALPLTSAFRIQGRVGYTYLQSQQGTDISRTETIHTEIGLSLTPHTEVPWFRLTASGGVDFVMDSSIRVQPIASLLAVARPFLNDFMGLNAELGVGIKAAEELQFQLPAYLGLSFRL